EVAKARSLVPVERIVAAKEDVLEALFERTFASLTPAAKRVFLLLASWRSAVARIALEATLLRPANERLDVESALDELGRSSLVELHDVEGEEGGFVTVPLAAGVFGRKKVETSPFKSAVEADREVVMLCGATQGTGLWQGVAPRLERLLTGIAERI